MDHHYSKEPRAPGADIPRASWVSETIKFLLFLKVQFGFPEFLGMCIFIVNLLSLKQAAPGSIGYTRQVLFSLFPVLFTYCISDLLLHNKLLSKVSGLQQ